MAEPAQRRLLGDLSGVIILVLAALGLGLYARSGCEKPRPVLADVGELQHPVFTLAEFREYVGGKRGLILDARPAHEHTLGHVPGALSVPVEDFDRAYARLKPVLEAERERVLVVYCGDMWCGLGDALQQKLINLHFQHVGTFPDGWQAWTGAGLPVEKSP